MFKKLIDNLMKPDYQLYALPTLHIRFVTGEEIDVVPDHWHITDKDWSLYYLESGLVLGRYPLASIVEVYEKNVQYKNVAFTCSLFYLPMYVHKSHMEGNNLFFEKKSGKVLTKD